MLRRTAGIDCDGRGDAQTNRGRHVMLLYARCIALLWFYDVRGKRCYTIRTCRLFSWHVERVFGQWLLFSSYFQPPTIWAARDLKGFKG